MRKSAKTALGGIIAALSVTIMLVSGLLPFLEYTLPAVAGTLITITVIELDKKWAFGTYVAVSLLSLIIVANKEAAMMYVAFFGYYPVLKPILEDKLPRVLEWICKLLVFNASIVVAYVIIIFVFGLSAELLEDIGTYMLPVLLVGLNVVFVLYDYVLTQLVTLYLRKLQKKLHSIFKQR